MQCYTASPPCRLGYEYVTIFSYRLDVRLVILQQHLPHMPNLSLNSGATPSSEAASLYDTVIAGGYCVGCGACAVPEHSPFKILMVPAGYYTAVMDASMEETEASRFACPFYDHGYDEDTLVPNNLRENAEHHPDVGWYRMLFAGHANDKDFRQRGSSGGLTNWLAAELLDKGMIDGVIHVKNTPTGAPGNILFEYALSRDVAELADGAKSKYYPIEISSVMALVRNQPGRYAFIGVPCFIKAVRLLAKSDENIRQSVKYCIALFCGHLKSRSFAEHAAWQLGIEPKNLTAFDFRTKVDDKPANRYAVTAKGFVDGQEVIRTIPTAQLYGSDWGEGLFKLKACDFCDDIVGETADISMGDAWLPQYIEESSGTNIVVVRNSTLTELLNTAASQGRIIAILSTVAEVHRSQDSNYRHRRDGLAYRLAQADAHGIWHPKKRIAADATTISSTRQRILDLRSQLRECSHVYFTTAKKSGRHDLFVDLMTPLRSAYRKALAAERNENAIHSRPVRPIQRRKNALISRLRYYTNRIHRELYRLERLASSKRKNALVLPPTTPGSLGDDALVSSTLSWLRKQGFQKIGLLEYTPNPTLSFTEKPDETLDLSRYMPTNPSKSAFDILKKARNYDYLFIVGADVLDGYYSDSESYHRLLLAYEAERLGIKTTLLGFSYNDSPAPQALKAMKQLGKKVRICTRDPVSRARLNSHLNYPSIQVADVAFLLNPTKVTDEHLLNWINQAHHSNAPIYGINAIFTSKFFTDRRAQSQSGYLNFYIDLIRAMACQRPDSRFLLIPHDYRPDGIGEGPILKHLYHQLPPELQNRTYLLTRQYSAAEIKWLAGQLDFIISSRMHLAIAAIGQGTPVFCFEYQGKFQGLFELLGMPELFSTMESAISDPQTLIAAVLQLIDSSATIRTRLREKAPELCALAEKNFDFSANAR